MVYNHHTFCLSSPHLDSITLFFIDVSEADGGSEFVLTEAQVKALEAAFQSLAGGSPGGDPALPDPSTLHKLAVRLDLSKSKIQVSGTPGALTMYLV